VYRGTLSVLSTVQSTSADTYFHGPYKQWIRSEAEQWYQVQFKALIARLDTGGLTLENMDDEIKKLMGLANLRNLAIKWNYAAMQRLSKMNL